MSIARPGDIEAGHPLQPVILRSAKLEAGDRDTVALRIGDELAEARAQAVPFAGYYTADTDPAAIAAANEERQAAEAEQMAE